MNSTVVRPSRAGPLLPTLEQPGDPEFKRWIAFFWTITPAMERISRGCPDTDMAAPFMHIFC